MTTNKSNCPAGKRLNPTRVGFASRGKIPHKSFIRHHETDTSLIRAILAFPLRCCSTFLVAACVPSVNSSVNQKDRAIKPGTCLASCGRS
jgi:hypothetical protein